MNFKISVFLGLALFFMFAYAQADEGTKQPEVDEHDKNIIPQSTGHPSEIFPNALANLITNGGIIALVVLVAGSFIAFLAPIIGLKLCTFLGTCDAGYQGYSAGPSYNDYTGYQQGTYNNPVYQKRSLEYIGPILKALGNAYDKYNRQPVTSSMIKSA